MQIRGGHQLYVLISVDVRSYQACLIGFEASLMNIYCVKMRSGAVGICRLWYGELFCRSDSSHSRDYTASLGVVWSHCQTSCVHVPVCGTTGTGRLSKPELCRQAVRLSSCSLLNLLLNLCIVVTMQRRRWANIAYRWIHDVDRITSLARTWCDFIA